MKSILNARQACSALISAILLVFTAQGLAAGNDAAKQEPVSIRSQGAQQQAMDLTCMDCHETVKGVKVRPGNYHGNCDSCHTGGEQHRQALVKGEAGKGTIALPQVKECLSCHKGDRQLMNWKFSEHSKAEAKCTDCHSIHTSPTSGRSGLSAGKIDKNSANCARCHQDVASRFNMTAHHPLNEGALSCISCHDPHGSSRTILKTRSDQCLSCHQAVRGPMVFEHDPVVEDCMNCHDPHGSPNRRLLNVSQPMLCLQCHSIAQGKHGYGSSEPSAVGTRIISGAVLRDCTNCHSAIHGSQQDPVLRY